MGIVKSLDSKYAIYKSNSAVYYSKNELSLYTLCKISLE